MRDIRERAAVDDRRSSLQRLHKVRLQCVLEECRHRALSLEVAGGHRLLVLDFAIGVADDDLRESLLQVADARREAEDRHDLGGHCDVVPVLARNAVHFSAETVDDGAELAVVHVDAALPGDLPRINIQLISLLDVVVDHRCQQVVGRSDRVHIACKMKINILHRHDLRVAAACGAALDAEDRSERRLTERDADLLAELSHAVRKADGRRRLAFTGRGRRDRRHEHQLSLVVGRRRFPGNRVDLSLVLAIELKRLIRNSRLLRDLRDRTHIRLLCDFDV